jgi:hypothetical protein
MAIVGKTGSLRVVRLAATTAVAETVDSIARLTLVAQRPNWNTFIHKNVPNCVAADDAAY